MKLMYAPWSSWQIDYLEGWQADPLLHSYTCRDHSRVDLEPGLKGWSCPVRDCHYKQEWASFPDPRPSPETPVEASEPADVGTHQETRVEVDGDTPESLQLWDLVLDRDSLVWQLKNRWVCVTQGLRVTPLEHHWDDLLADRGPLTLVRWMRKYEGQ